MKKAIFLGNGIHRMLTEQTADNQHGVVNVVTRPNTWEDLLNKIAMRFGVAYNGTNYTPSPIVFEQMLNDKAGSNHDERIKQLKKAIAQILSTNTLQNSLSPVVCQLIQSPVYSEILTTNYDYAIEKSLKSDFVNNRATMALDRTETLYSLKRGYAVDKKKVWHIHGELYSPKKAVGSHYSEESIMIGYEHYGAYLKRIEDIIKEKRSIPSQRNQYPDWVYGDLKKRLLNSDEMDQSPYWVDRFFMCDMDIVGQGLDFSEMHLWWLLSYRKRLMDENRVNNTIRYFYMDIPSSANVDSILVAKELAVRCALNSLQVECVPISCNSYTDGYTKLLQIP